MWICGGFAPCGPSALFATKRPKSKKECHLANPLIMGQRLRIFQKYRFLFLGLFIGQNVVFWVKNWCFRVFWTECEVVDLKQRQGITTMDHRNKIQSLVLPTDDPKTPRTACVNMALYCEYGRICHKSANFSK